MRDAALIIALAIPVLLLAAVGVAWYRRCTPRETTTEPVSPEGTTTTARTVLLPLVHRPHREPDYQGATEDWSPAADVKQAEATPSAEPAPDFDTDRWDTDVHAELNAIEDAVHDGATRVETWAYDQLGIDAKTRMRLPSAIEATGEIALDEINALLMEGASA